MAENIGSHPSFEGKANSFESFQPFIFTGGLSRSDGKRFTAFLRHLYIETGNYWRPGKCFRVFDIKDSAREIVRDYFSTKPSFQVGHSPDFTHTWVVMKGQAIPTLVIDAAGLGIPYFGPMEPVEGENFWIVDMKERYRNGALLDPQTTAVLQLALKKGDREGLFTKPTVLDQESPVNAIVLEAR